MLRPLISLYLLKIHNYEVESAINGVEALEKVRISPPDIIISDILMPEMDGFELCQILKKDQQFREIPVIFYTATYTEPSDQKFALSMGATRFVIKPEDPDKLLRIVAEVVAEYEERELERDGQELENGAFKRKHTETISKKLYKKIHELEEQKEQLRIITDTMPELIAEIDTSGCYRYVNKAYEKWFNVPYHEIIGRTIEDIVGEKAFNIMRPYIQKAEQGEEISYEEQIPDNDGNIRYVKIRYIPRSREEGKSNSFFSFTYDLTDQKLAEQDKEKLVIRLQHSEKMDAIGQLASGIAHDFNNILTAIIGYSEFIQKEVFQESNIGKNIEQVLVSGHRAAKLVNQILSCSRQHNSVKHSIEPHLIVREALGMLHAALPATVTIEENIDSECGRIVAEPTVIHQVVINLCTNALQAMEEQKGTLQISLKRQELTAAETSERENVSPGSFVVLTVRDNGCGMDQSVIDRIFEPYFTTKEVGKGTGLGLAIIHCAVEEYKGFIEVESRVGKGSVFSVYLPLSEESVILSVAPQQQDRRAVDPNTARILVVDDEPLIAKISEIRLTGQGYQVTAVTDSREALEVFRNQPAGFDLLVTDQTMPGLTGEELARAVFAINPSLPIIMCTGHSSVASEEEALAMGVKKYIFKPLYGNELLDAVQEVLAGV